MKYGSSSRLRTARNSSSLVLKCQKISALLTFASRATSDIEVSWKPRRAKRRIPALRISSRESCGFSGEIGRDSDAIYSGGCTLAASLNHPGQTIKQGKQESFR